MHYYKFNIADWGLSTSHLSLEEEAIYFRLINFYYDSESPIPLETQSVFRRLRVGSNNELADSILTEFFEETDKGWIHLRCENVLKDYRKTAKKNKANGAKGGRPKGGAASSISQDKPSGLPNESQNNPNQEPLTTNHKPITKEIKTLDQSQIDRGLKFDRFWHSGIRKVNKKKTIPIFNKLLLNATPVGGECSVCEEDFTVKLINDIQKRLNSNQLGFAEMHPTTYLNGERWNDEVIPNAENQYGRPSGSNRQTPAQRTRAAGERWEAEQEANVQVVGGDAGGIRPPMEQPVRGGANGDVGTTLDGDYTRTD